MLNPIHRGARREDMLLYKVEPYVMAADIYAVAPHTGRGGWTWYTGAAGWMYRLTVETLLGLRLAVDRLYLAPRVPDEWSEYRVHYRYRETFYHIVLRRSGERATRIVRITLDGAVIGEDGGIPLTDDRRDHHVDVELG